MSLYCFRETKFPAQPVEDGEKDQGLILEWRTGRSLNNRAIRFPGKMSLNCKLFSFRTSSQFLRV